ncbi:hypothetical protein SAMN05216548_12710 [Faunimonas pinastri]|uniref:Uncharacterized protein n=1 Tax=Faunimonas pinastri TaxID=1855383 RepID=A0A1H9QDN5_9HYPH|nr:hypothetical protein [Faunimonas pinastri]SER58285.1 hypothetical protein SAMN05216548_12710 [Faunimonas pinastri]
MTVITKAALAAELRVSKPRISQYCKRGLPVRGDGKIDREAALNWINRYCVSQTSADKGANRAQRIVREGGVKPATPKQSGRSKPMPGLPKSVPHGLEPVDDCFNPFDQGALAVGMSLAYRTAGNATVVAVMAGAPMKIAYTIERLMKIAMMEAVASVCEGLGPFEGNADPDIWNLEAFVKPRWEWLALQAGEPVDEAAWETYRQERLQIEGAALSDA